MSRCLCYNNIFVSHLRDLLSEFHSTLSDMKRNRPLVLLVDGVDLVLDGRGQVGSDWIPQQLPQVGQKERKLSPAQYKESVV